MTVAGEGRRGREGWNTQKSDQILPLCIGGKRVHSNARGSDVEARLR